VVAGHRRLHDARREHRLQLFRHERVFPLVRARVRLESNGDLRGVSLARVESGLLGPIEGYLTDRVGAHRMLFIGLILCSLGFVMLSLVDSLPMLYGVIVLGIVLGSSLGYNMPISVLIAKLFRERRSLAFGIFRMGPGISGPLVPLVGWMIGLWGWRAAAVISGIIIFSVGLPIAWIIYKIYLQEGPPSRTPSIRALTLPRRGIFRTIRSSP
jgi:MFS family permease